MDPVNVNVYDILSSKTSFGKLTCPQVRNAVVARLVEGPLEWTDAICTPRSLDNGAYTEQYESLGQSGLSVRLKSTVSHFIIAFFDQKAYDEFLTLCPVNLEVYEDVNAADGDDNAADPDVNAADGDVNAANPMD